MRLKWKLALLLFTGLFFVMPVEKARSDPPVYTLDTLYEMALGVSEEVKLAEETLYVTELDKKRALSVLIPRLSAFGDYLRYDEEKRVNGSPVQPEWSSTYGVRLDHSFTLNGKELIALELSKNQIARERLNLAAGREALLMRVAEAYYNSLKAQKTLEIATANVDRLEVYKEAVQKRLKAGTTTKTDLFRASAELSGAISDKIRSTNHLTFAKSTLARLTGMAGPFQIDSPDLTSQAFPEFDLATLKAEALQSRSDLKALRVAQEAAENNVRLSKSAWWPRLGIEGVWARPDAASKNFAPVENRLWAGMNLSFPLYEGGRKKAELNQSRARKRQADLRVRALKKQIALEVDEAYLNFITRKNTITALADQLTFARENLEAVTRQLEFGLANSIDAVDANTLLVTAERQLAEAVYESHLALLRIEQTTGRLLENVQARLGLPH